MNKIYYTTLAEVVDNIVEMAVKRVLLEMTREEKKNEEQSEEVLLTAKEAEQMLRISRPTLHRWKRKGIIPHVRFGNTIRYKKSDLEKLMDK